MSAIEDYFAGKASKEQAAEELAGDNLLKKHSPGFFMKLLDVLDRPGNATRALMVGKLGGLKGLIPFAQLIENLTGFDIALNEDERVPGTEVIETFFGKQRQRKGKIDMVDALGLLVEVAADPLWLVGGGGLTKVGKARQLVGSNIKGLLSSAKAARAAGKADDAAKLIGRASDILRSIHTGNIGGVKVSKKMAKAMQTVAKAKGPTSLRSLSWTKQAKRGERAVLNILGKPVIKGEGTIAAAEKFVNKLRTGAVGEKFLSATRRTNLENADLHKIFNSVKGEEQYKYGKLLDRLKKAQDNLQKPLARKTGMSMEEVGELASRMAELGDNPEKYTELIRKIRSGGIPLSEAEGIEAGFSRFTTELDEITNAIGKENIGTLRELASEQKIADKWISEAAAMGVPLNELTGDLKYVPRIMTKEYNKATKGNVFRIEKPQASGLGIYKGKATKGRDVTAEMLRGRVDKLYAAPVGAKRMFEPDLLSSLSEGGRQHMNRIISARTVRDAINKYGRPIKGKVDDGYVAIGTILKKMDDAGLPAMKDLDRTRQIPMDIANALFNSFEQTIKKESDIAASNLWEGAQRLMKSSYTVTFPAFHSRNAMSNKVLNWLEGTWKPSAYVDAFNLQKAAAKTRKIMRREGIDFIDAAKKVDWPELTINGQKMKGYELFDIADKKGVLGRTIGIFDPEEVAGATFSVPHSGAKKLLTGEDPLTRAGRTVGSTIEDNDRLAHFIDKLSDGFNPDDAAASVKTALFDYSDLSDFEKKWLRDRFVFFYTFSRKNIGQQARKLMQQPAKQGLFAHLAGGTPRIQGEGKYQPDYMNEQLTMPTPFRDKKGNRYILKSIGMPIEEAFGPLAAPGTGIWNRTSRLASRQLSRMNPFATAATELAFKKNLYFDQPITDPVEWAIQKTPIGRAYGTYTGFSRGRDPSASKITGLLAGVRFDAPDPVEQKAYKVREIARQYLAKSRQTRNYSRYYVPKNVEVNDPTTKYALDVQR